MNYIVLHLLIDSKAKMCLLLNTTPNANRFMPANEEQEHYFFSNAAVPPTGENFIKKLHLRDHAVHTGSVEDQQLVVGTNQFTVNYSRSRSHYRK